MTKRYHFEGRLVTETGLHIGSGSGDFETDARFVRMGDGRFYIPGSSLKGVLRSAIERALAAFGPNATLSTCALDAGNDFGTANCPTVNTHWQDLFNAARKDPQTDEEMIQDWLYKGGLPGAEDVKLCHTCRLFGSPYSASLVHFQDAVLLEPADVRGEIRHGVGIDRDTGAARAQIKFDYEALPAECTFKFEVAAHDLDDIGLGLLCAGLREMENGAITLGGNVSRGLGRCTLALDGVDETNLSTPSAWLRHLLNQPGSTAKRHQDAKAIKKYVDDAIGAILARLEV